MKNVFKWIWNHMKGFALFWVILPFLTVVFPETAVPIFAFVVLFSVFMGICETLWLDEVPYPGEEE